MEAEERLLEELREQIVAGQVETLLSLEHSSAALRSEAAALTAATRGAIASATLAISSEAEQAVARVQAATAAAEAALAAAVHQAANELSQRVESALAAVARASEEAGRLAEVGRRDVNAQLIQAVVATREAAREVSAAAEATNARLLAGLADERREWLGLLSTSLEEAEVATTQMSRQITEAGASTSEGMAMVGERVVGSLEEEGVALAAHAAGFAGDVESLLQRWEKRDARRESRAEERITSLVKRIHDSWQGHAAALAAETERLAIRDRAQERQRAQEFAAVLQDVLGRAGLSARGLRRRVRKVLEEDRSSAQPTPEPVPTAPREAATPSARRRRKTTMQNPEES